jgi:hypothetical protein
VRAAAAAARALLSQPCASATLAGICAVDTHTHTHTHTTTTHAPTLHHRTQVSKLTTVLLRACRTAAGCSSWDPLVVGRATGRLVEMRHLDPAALAGEVVLVCRGGACTRARVRARARARARREGARVRPGF